MPDAVNKVLYDMSISLNRVFVFEFVKCVRIGAPPQDPAQKEVCGIWGLSRNRTVPKANHNNPPGPDPRAQHLGRHPPASVAAKRAAEPTADTGGRWPPPNYQGRGGRTTLARPPPPGPGGPTTRDPPPAVCTAEPSAFAPRGPGTPPQGRKASPPPSSPQKRPPAVYAAVARYPGPRTEPDTPPCARHAPPDRYPPAAPVTSTYCDTHACGPTMAPPRGVTEPQAC